MSKVEILFHMKFVFQNQNEMKYKSWIVTPLLFASTALSAQNNVAPTLQELIDSAIVNSKNVQIQQYNLEAAQIKGKKALEAYIPTLSIHSKYAYLQNSSELSLPPIDLNILGLTQINIPEQNLPLDVKANIFTADAEASMLLVSGGKVPLLHKAGKENIKAQEALLAISADQMKAKIIKSYDQIALLQQLKKVLDEAEKRYEVNAATAQKAHEYGLITSYELQKINVAAAQLDARKTAYLGQTELLLKNLETLTHIPAERLQLLVPQIEAIVTDKASDYSQRHELSALKAGVNAKTYLWKAEKTWWIPKVKAIGSVGYVQGFDINLSNDRPLPLQMGNLNLDVNKLEIWPNYKIGIGMQWDVFDGLKGHRATQLARIEVEQAQLQLDKTEELMALNLVKVNNDVNRLNKELLAKDKQLKLAEDALKIAEKEFKVGLIKAADLVNAESDYQNAALERVQTLFEQRRAVVQQMEAQGFIDTSKF